jgi:hypothetical protein
MRLFPPEMYRVLQGVCTLNLGEKDEVFEWARP